MGVLVLKRRARLSITARLIMPAELLGRAS